MSLAQQFFDRARQPEHGCGFLRSLVQSQPPTFESDWLDFKGVSKTPDDRIKEIWSKALGGFANTGGGVVVFGIDARKDSVTGIDCASGLSLAPAAFALKSRLLELHTGATDPPVLGVRVEAFTANGTEGEGFVVAFVPESPDRPHRSEHAGRRFYIRAGDDFCVASVSLLRSLFYPHSRCRLVPYLRLNPPDKEQQVRVTTDIIVRNTGTATAYDPFAIIRHPPGFTALPVHFSDTTTGSPRNPFSLTLNRDLHPGLENRLLRLNFYPSADSDFEKGIILNVSLFSKDAEPVCWTLNCAYYDIIKENFVKAASKSQSILYHGDA